MQVEEPKLFEFVLFASVRILKIGLKKKEKEKFFTSFLYIKIFFYSLIFFFFKFSEKYEPYVVATFPSEESSLITNPIMHFCFPEGTMIMNVNELLLSRYHILKRISQNQIF